MICFLLGIVLSLNTWNDEISKAMAHPTKRRIIECLQNADLSFMELLNEVGKSNHGGFGYHLRSLKAFIEVEPSTRKYRLSDRGKVLANVLRDFRLITSVNDEYANYVQNLRLGDHAIGVYTTQDFKDKILFSFLKAGLTKGEATLYIVPENKLDSEIGELQRFGINFDYSPREIFTIMSAYDWYLERGKAQAKTIIANWQRLIKEKQKIGFTGVRVAGHMEVFFDHDKTEELLRYEESLGKQLALDLCALCLYDRDRLDTEQFIRAYKCHGHIISKGIAGKTGKSEATS